MNVSVAWLRELAPSLGASADELADRLSMTAVPVDAVEAVGEGLEGVRVGRVLDAEPHPNADRLTLCRVEAGSGEAVEVVCGAPVIETGGLYPYVPPGAELPGGFRIESREVRGRVSHGMLCSAHELKLGRDRGGILRLPDELEPGRPLPEALGLPDRRLVLDLTPNRVDLACHVGVARELAERGGAELALRPTEAAWEPAWSDGEPAAEAAGVRVEVEDGNRCRRYLGAVLRGVRVGPSPAWMATRLRVAGMEPVNNVVDATNYVLLELNQPIHAFDLATLGGSEVRVRAARPGETLTTLDGERRQLDPEVTVIADAERPVALAGLMGGRETEVTAGTTELFLECAAFHPGWVRKAARRVGLATEASYRFERGIDERGLERALARCVTLILDVAGGRVEPEAPRVGGPPPERGEVPLRPERVGRLLGIRPGRVELGRFLEPLGFELSGGEGETDGPLRVLVPGWRTDVTREVDLIEEVARRHGYQHFPDEPRRFRASAVPDDPAWDRADRVRAHFAGRGLLEARSVSFVPERMGGARAQVRVLNPLSAEEGWLRPSLVPVLLRRVEHNFARARRDVRLFEIGSVFHAGDGDGGLEAFVEEIRVAAVLTGRRRPPHWEGEVPEVDVWDLKGLAAGVVDGLLAEGAVLEPLPPDAAADRSRWDGDWLDAEGFRIVAGGETVGVAGRVREEAVDAPPWGGPVWGLEFPLEAVAARPATVHRAHSPYPPVRRDLAVTVPRRTAAARLEEAIRKAGPETLEAAELFDVYEGEGVEGDRRSLAWSLRFRAPDRTLTDQEVEAAMQEIVRALTRRYDARIRSG